MARSSSVWRWQLIFTGSTVTIAVMIAALRPATFTAPLFLAGLALIIATTLAVLTLPWERMPEWAAFLVPIIDALAIGMMTNAPDVRLSYLWVIPVAWIATYYSMPYVIASIAFIAICRVALSNSPGEPGDILLQMLVLVLTLVFLGTTVRIGSQRSRAATRLLRRQSEQVNRAADRAETHRRRVTQIIDALGAALVCVDEDGTVLHMNDAYRRLYGHDRFGARGPEKAVEYGGRQGEPVPPDRTALARAARGEVLRAERTWLFDAAGRWRTLELTTEPIASDAEGRLTTLLVIDDVTEMLEAAEQRRAMIAMVSHELRNPLTAVLGHVDLLLERDDLPERARDQLQIVEGAAERMQRLVTSSLESSRFDTGLLAEPVDLRQLVDASVASFDPTARVGGVEIGIDGIGRLFVEGDAFRLRQAIDNLLSNAVKYTPSGGVVSISLSASDDEALLIVRDTGHGMSESEVGSMFEPYFRSESARAANIPGSGLGMGIVRDIISAHAGTLEVHSTPGVGTSVRVRLPRSDARTPGGAGRAAHARANEEAS